jgi:hypothetical protein
MTDAPDRYTARFDDGHMTLCRGCASVLLLEGVLGGDPTEEKVSAGDVLGLTPCLVERECDNCDAIRRFEEKRALLPAPPKRLYAV